MKVALVLFGQARFLDNSNVISANKNILFDKYNVDTYGHIWFSDNIDSYEVSDWSTISDAPIIKKTKEIINHHYPNTNIIYEEPKKFEPPLHLIEKYKGHVFFNEYNLKNVMSHLYSFESSSKILRNTIEKYDFIIISRTDVLIHNIPSLYSLPKPSFNISNHHNRFPDLLFILTPEFINFFNVFTNFNDNINKVWEPSPEAFKWETFKKYYNNSINPIDMKIEIVRS